MAQLYNVTILTILKDVRPQGEVILTLNKIPSCYFYLAFYKNVVAT